MKSFLIKISTWVTSLVSPNERNLQPSQSGFPVVYKKMSPTSKDRAEWVSKRIQVLTAMHQELATRPGAYVERGQHDLHAAVLNSIRAEKLQLNVELEVLLNAIATQEANNGTAS